MSSESMESGVRRDGKKTSRERRRIVTLLRASVLATAALILCWPLTTPVGVAAAALGAFCGALLADRADRVKLSGGLLLAFFGSLSGVVLSRWLVSAAWLADLLSPLLALRLGDGLLWLSLCGGGVFMLRLLAERRPTLAVLEVAAVATATAVAFAAHRQGMVHRPLEIGDWAWTRGFDPAVVFLALGGLGTILLAGLMIREGRKRRLPLHFSALLAVGLLLVIFVRVEGLPRPDPAGDLGLTGEPEDGEGGEGDPREAGGQGRGESRDQLGDLEFKDEYGSGGQQAPVAVVVLHDDYSPPTGVYYFRQSAFSQYNGRRLVQALADDVDRDILRRFPFEPYEVPGAPPTSARRKALLTSIGLMVDHVRPFALDSPVRFVPSENPDPMRFQRVFEVRSHVRKQPYSELIGLRPGDPAWGEETWRLYTEAPADPRYGELASELLGVLRDEYRDDPLAKALAVKTYLDENGIYSRKSRHAGAGDPAASFLFGDLTGYCVHFAHAATYLMRAVGLPARVAAGYAVSEADRGGGSAILVRGANAHAWPEVYLEGAGWVVVDLAPEQSLDDPAQPPDQRLQQMLGEMMRKEPGETDPFEDALRQSVDWGAVLERVLWALAILALVGHAVKLHRRLAPRFVRGRGVFRLGYRAGLDRLAEVGLRRRRGETREDFARRAAAASPTFVRLTDHHVAWALGSSRLPPPETTRRLDRDVGSDLAESLPLWRRVLGWLDPTAWLRSR